MATTSSPNYVINNGFQLKFKSNNKTTQQETTLPMTISHKQWMIFFFVNKRTSTIYMYSNVFL